MAKEEIDSSSVEKVIAHWYWSMHTLLILGLAGTLGGLSITESVSYHDNPPGDLVFNCSEDVLFLSDDEAAPMDGADPVVTTVKEWRIMPRNDPNTICHTLYHRVTKVSNGTTHFGQVNHGQMFRSTTALLTGSLKDKMRAWCSLPPSERQRYTNSAWTHGLEALCQHGRAAAALEVAGWTEQKLVGTAHVTHGHHEIIVDASQLTNRRSGSGIVQQTRS